MNPKQISNEIETKFKIGEIVDYTNENGVHWGPRKIIGRETWYVTDVRYYISPTDTPWFSVKESCFCKLKSYREHQHGHTSPHTNENGN